MFDHLLNDALFSFVGPVVMLFAAFFALVLFGRWMLMRFAPDWLVGPHGLLIDTKTGMGMLQVGDGHIYRHGQEMPDSGSEPGDTTCR